LVKSAETSQKKFAKMQQNVVKMTSPSRKLSYSNNQLKSC